MSSLLPSMGDSFEVGLGRSPPVLGGVPDQADWWKEISTWFLAKSFHNHEPERLGWRLGD
jgi:hypothetical protein